MSHPMRSEDLKPVGTTPGDDMDVDVGQGLDALLLHDEEPAEAGGGRHVGGGDADVHKRAADDDLHLMSRPQHLDSNGNSKASN